MIRKHWPIWAGIGAVLLLFTGCAATSQQEKRDDADHTALVERIDPLIETLHLNCRELEQIAKDLRSISEGYIYGSDEQLNYINSAHLYTTKAEQTICYQWSMLSILDYIKPDMRRDFFTYQTADLKRALFENTYDLTFLNTYEAFVERPEAVADIRKAADLIRQSNDSIEKLIRHLAPLANPNPPPDQI